MGSVDSYVAMPGVGEQACCVETVYEGEGCITRCFIF